MEMTSKAFHDPEYIRLSKQLDQFCENFWASNQTIDHFICRINDRSPHGERIRREKNPTIIYCIGIDVPQDQNDGKWLLGKVGLTQGDKNEPYNRMERVKNKIMKADHDPDPKSIFELPVSATDTSSIFSIEDRIRRTIGIRVGKKVIKEWHLPNKTEWVLTTKEYVSKKLQPQTTMKDASTDLFNNPKHMLIGNKKKGGDQEESEVERIRRFCEDNPLPPHLQLDGCIITKIPDPLQHPQQQTSSKSSAQQGSHVGCAQSVRAEQSLTTSSNMPDGSKTPRKSGKSPACSSKQASRPSPRKDGAVSQSNAPKSLNNDGEAFGHAVDVSRDVQIPILKPSTRKRNSISSNSSDNRTSELQVKRMKITSQSEGYSSNKTTLESNSPRAQQGIPNYTNSKRPTKETFHLGGHSIRADQNTTPSSTMSNGLKTQRKEGESPASSKQHIRPSPRKDVPILQSNVTKRICHGGEASSSKVDVSKDVQNLKPPAIKKNSASCKSINSQTSELQDKRMKTIIQSEVYSSTLDLQNSRAQGIASNTNSKRLTETTSHAGSHSVREDQTTIHSSSTMSGGLKLKTQTKKGKSPASSSKQPSRPSSRSSVPEAMVAQSNAVKRLCYSGEASSSEVDVSKDVQNLKSPAGKRNSTSFNSSDSQTYELQAKKMKTTIQSAACYSTNTTIPDPPNSRTQGIASNTKSKRPTEKTSPASVHSLKAEQTMTPSSTMSDGLKTQTERGKLPASSFKQPSSPSSTRGVPEAYHSSINTTIPDPHNSIAQQRIAKNTNSGRPTEKTSQRPSKISSPHTRERKVSPEDLTQERNKDDPSTISKNPQGKATGSSSSHRHVGSHPIKLGKCTPVKKKSLPSNTSLLKSNVHSAHSQTKKKTSRSKVPKYIESSLEGCNTAEIIDLTRDEHEDCRRPPAHDRKQNQEYASTSMEKDKSMVIRTPSQSCQNTSVNAKSTPSTSSTAIDMRRDYSYHKKLLQCVAEACTVPGVEWGWIKDMYS